MSDLEIRRGDLLGLRRTGIVRWFKDDKGYGRITADDGEVLFVHFSGIVGECFRALEQGQRVSFVWDGSEAAHGRHVAVDVRLERISNRRRPARSSSSSDMTPPRARGTSRRID